MTEQERLIRIIMPCFVCPSINGEQLSVGDTFDLYCADVGKPRNLIALY